jgi:hypothetical protein
MRHPLQAKGVADKYFWKGERFLPETANITKA